MKKKFLTKNQRIQQQYSQILRQLRIQKEVHYRSLMILISQHQSQVQQRQQNTILYVTRLQGA